MAGDQAEDGQKHHTIFYTKNRRNKVRKIVREVYLRDDVPCGIGEVDTQRGVTDGAEAVLSTDDTLLILDTNVAMNQMDFLSEDPSIDNVVIPYTLLMALRKKSFNLYNKMRALCRGDGPEKDTLDKNRDHSAEHAIASRRFFVFANEFCRGCFVAADKRESANQRNQRAIFEVCKFYEAQINCKPGDGRVVLLTHDTKTKEAAHDQGINSLTVYEYVDSVKHKYPNAGEKLAAMTNALAEQDCEMASDEDGAESEPELKHKISDRAKELLDREAIYPAHWSTTAVTKGLKDKKIYQGVIRMQQNTCFHAVVMCHSIDQEIEIEDSAALNRAVDGDVVAVQFLSDKANLELKEKADDEVGTKDEIQTAGDLLKEQADMPATSEERKKGRVVGIVKRNWREYSGTLRPLSEDRKEEGGTFSKTTRVFIPANPRIPFIHMQTRHSSDLENMRLIACIDHWDRFSHHPAGHWVRVLGPVGDRDTESKVILHEHGVITREFSEAVMRCLPPKDWVPTEQDIAERLDLRDMVVCSIDPPGCKDIDDALSAEVLPNGNWRLGVHIADVTHFVKPDTPIDREAAERCTTVYLVEKRTDMFPGLLTTDLCSLVGKVDRNTFTVLWEMTPEGEILNTEFHKAVIHSNAALSYAEAQARIDDPNDHSDLTEGIRRLNKIAKIIRKKRMDSGALELASQEVRFELDKETADPTDVTEYTSRETNKLVEEFMLLANCSVAEKILDVFPMYSVLRRHPPPKEDACKQLQKLLSKQGFDDFKYGSNKELADSLNGLNTKDPFFNKLVRMMTCRCMNQAIYFCTGEVERKDYFHYGLAMPLYTHFTSPIRRYADVLVHRLLAAAIGLCSIPEQLHSRPRIHDQCEVINTKHRNAQWSGRASVDLHTYLFFNKRGPTVCDAVVTRCRNGGVQVIVPRYGIEGIANLPKDEWTLDSDRQVMIPNDGGKEIAVFDHLEVLISSSNKNFRFKTHIDFQKISTKAVDFKKEEALYKEEVDKQMFPQRVAPGDQVG